MSMDRNFARRVVQVLGLPLMLGIAGCGLRFGSNSSGPAELDPDIAREQTGGAGTTIQEALANRRNEERIVQVNRYIWTASLQVLNFLPIQEVDPYTGVIITGFGTPPGGGNSYRATVLIQDGGMKWMEFRNGPLKTCGAYLLGGTLELLILFYLIRGRIPVDFESTERTVVRFNSVERFGHWLLAISFILLGITGLVTLFGRKVIIPWLTMALLDRSRWPESSSITMPLRRSCWRWS